MTRAPGTLEEAVELYLARRKRGEALDVGSFCAEHPHFGEELLHALEGLALLDSTTSEAALAPECVGPYRIVCEIGRGGMGVVFEAVEEPLGRRVALKLLPSELLASPNARARFRREAELASRLDHSGIATIYGAGVEGEHPWIAMRYVEGRTLARTISESRTDGASCARLAASPAKGREAALRVADLLAKVARALYAAHERGVVHRDIKPSNVIVQPDGSPVLLDFGLAITEEADGHSLTRTGEAPGTPAYLAPETIGGEIARPDAQSDVYALGVTLYEALALRRPFEAPTQVALYRAILDGSPPGLRSFNASVPRDLAVVAATAIERDRSRRYRNAAALAEDLEACVAGRPIAARPIPPLGRLARWVRREPRLAAAISAAIAIAALGLAWISIVQTAASKAIARKNDDLFATNASLAAAKAAAEANERIATQKSDDVLSLSAIQELKELVEEADALWPVFPDKVAAYDEWLSKASLLVDGVPGGHPGLRDHEAKLAEIRLRAKPGSSGAFDFDDPKDRWWHVQLAELVADLKSITDEKTGLLSEGISDEHGWGILRRRREAASIEARTVNGPDARERWLAAAAGIAASPKYGGLSLAPQIGLLPIGADADSGLWEFADVQTGEPPERGADGKLVVTEESGLVLVLIPAGTFWMGSQKADPAGENYDAHAHDDEVPVHEVGLRDYFLSKYEMTQGQWSRFVGRNPSYYGPSADFDGRKHDLRHPVEAVSWSDCIEVLGRIGLSLPTEAQWERACRGGTGTTWWAGDDRSSLLGKVNLADKAFVRAGGPKSIADDWPDLDDGWVSHAPVGTFAPNPFGLHEVHGNLWEWCRDGFGSYGLPTNAGDGERQTPAEANKTIRGGCFNGVASASRSARRYFGTPTYRDDIVGVRPARSVTRG